MCVFCVRTLVPAPATVLTADPHHNTQRAAQHMLTVHPSSYARVSLKRVPADTGQEVRYGTGRQSQGTNNQNLQGKELELNSGLNPDASRGEEKALNTAAPC